ncbi:hypothetical protein Tco_0956685 [Tanacetum coccineum]
MKILAQQAALDNAMVSLNNRVKIGKCNMRIIPKMTKKESTYQFWRTITKIKDSSSYQFKLDKKKCRVDVEVFHDIFQISLRLPNQEFVKPPSSDEEIISFIKEQGYKGDNQSITKKARKFKKPATPSKKKTLVVVEEPAEKPTKTPAAKRLSTGDQIRDTPGVSVSKKKAPTKAEGSKGIELLSEAALLKES